MTTYDLYIRPLPEVDQSVQSGIVSYGVRRTIGVTGLQRMVNRWMLEFLTDEGSDPSDPSRGTPFIRLIGSNVSDEREIREICEVAVNKATQRMLLTQQNGRDYTDNDRLRSAEITRIVYDDTRLQLILNVRLTSQAQKSQLLEVPIPFQLGT